MVKCVCVCVCVCVCAQVQHLQYERERKWLLDRQNMSLHLVQFHRLFAFYGCKQNISSCPFPPHCSNPHTGRKWQGGERTELEIELWKLQTAVSTHLTLHGDFEWGPTPWFHWGELLLLGACDDVLFHSPCGFTWECFRRGVSCLQILLSCWYFVYFIISSWRSWRTPNSSVSTWWRT